MVVILAVKLAGEVDAAPARGLAPPGVHKRL